jgi:nicotinamide N-methyltransferase
LAEEGCFDVILIADTIFNHNQHENLLKSCKELLRSNGVVLTTYSHHVVKWADRDMLFFDIAKDMGFTAEQIYIEKWQEMFPEDSGSLDVRRTVYAWKLYVS